MMRNFLRPRRSLAVAEHGMAATSHPADSLVALDILRAGDNAVDGALAAVAMHGGVDPHMTSPGGDCFALLAAHGRPTIALNGTGRATRGTSLDWFLKRGNAAIPDLSPHGITVPGAVDDWFCLSVGHGRLTLDAVLRPAIRAEEEGLPAVAAELSRRGQTVRIADEPIGGYQGIWMDHARGGLLGASDHREHGMALSY